jgi:hypothetical protein
VQRVAWKSEDNLLSCVMNVRSASEHEVTVIAAGATVWSKVFATTEEARREAERLRCLFLGSGGF